jgi:hypothetical protein
MVPDQIRQWVPGRYVVLGTDGFGRSDARAALRQHFEVDRRYIAVAALKALADEGKIDMKTVSAAIGSSASIPTSRTRRRSEAAPWLRSAGGRSGPRRLQGRRSGRRARQAGDTVAVDTPLITLETEKATMDVPCTAAGAAAEAGADQPPERPARPAEPSAEPSPQPATAKAQEAPVTPGQISPASAAAGGAVEAPGFSSAHATPSIRRFARELGVDLAKVNGSGAKGRITEQDVKAHVKRLLTEPAAAAGAALPSVPQVDFAAFGAIERRPLSRIQKIAGRRLHASWVNVPHVTQFDEADITEMEATRASSRTRRLRAASS